MKIRVKNADGAYSEGTSSNLSMHSTTEVVVYLGNECNTMQTSEVEVLVTDNWYNMQYAFIRHIIVPDNSSTKFDIPIDELSRIRGYNPY